MKLDGVGPVDNRPSTGKGNASQICPEKKKKKKRKKRKFDM